MLKVVKNKTDETLKSVKINYAVREFLKKKIGTNQKLHKDNLDHYFDYLRDIQKDFIVF